MIEEGEKEYVNKDLHGLSFEKFCDDMNTSFIGDDFIEQLEWAMMMIRGKFKQIRAGEHLLDITANHFDKAYLMADGLRDDLGFFAPFTDLQATPEIFPAINIKTMTIGQTVQLQKVREHTDFRYKKSLGVKRKRLYELSYAMFKKDTEAFYGVRKGYEFNDGFFKIGQPDANTSLGDIPTPISLHPNYRMATNPLQYVKKEEIVDICQTIGMAYQVAMSFYYEWSIYIKEYGGIGLVIPIEPTILKEIYQTSALKFDTHKRMLHFVRDHYRRKKANPAEDYSVYVHKYLRGEHKFDYRGFYAEIVPPKYDLNRVKTRKKFIDVNSD